MMSMTMFKEVFSELIDYLVERIQNNYALQILPNALLANSSTSATFASILLGFLLKVRLLVFQFLELILIMPRGVAARGIR